MLRKLNISKLKPMLFMVLLTLSQWVMASPSGDSKPETILKTALTILMGLVTIILTLVVGYEGCQVLITKTFDLKRIGVIVIGALLAVCCGTIAGLLVGSMH